MKRTIIGLLVAAALLFLLGWGSFAAFQETGGTSSVREAPKLAERVKVLETEVKALTDKYEQSAGFTDTEYVLRIQRHYEEYYEKVLNTQTNMMWAVGILLTVLLGVAGLFSFRQFDRQIDSTSRRVAAEQRVEFERRLEAEITKLEEENSEKVSSIITELTVKTDQAIEDLHLKSRILRNFDSGLIFAALEQYRDSIIYFRDAIRLYVKHRDQGLVEKQFMGSAVANLFRSLRKSDEDKFEENAATELKSDFYRELEEELAIAGSLFPALRDLRLRVGEARGRKGQRKKT